jgi:hypothetical protein
MNGDSDLLKVILTSRSLRRFPDVLYSREQECD